jgi:FKBP-type peptidyl-prolyl cis-trans isomerase SlyD
MKIESGRIALLQYEVTDADGVVHESSSDHGPMDYIPGEGALPEALESELQGKSEGDQLDVTLQPADAFGEYDPGVLVTVPRSRFPEDADMTKGTWVSLELELEEGDDPELELEDMELRVLDSNADGVVLDANHPLAGKTVTFKVKVLAVREA